MTVVIVGCGVLLYAQWGTFFGKPQEPTHGPKLSSLNDQIASADSQPIPPSSTSPPPAPPAPQPPPAPSVVGIAAGGGLTGLDQAALDQYFAQLKALGAGWVRWDLDWTWIQPNGPGSYEWAASDRVAATAQKYGIQSLGIITYTPEWARQSDCRESQFCAPADPAAFADFAGQVAARYKGQNMHHWEIWNEPNTSGFWLPAANAVAYTNLLKSAYAAIKAVNPGAAVISAGLAPTATEDGNIAPISFVETMYQNGAKDSFDALGMHPYSYPVVASHQAVWNAWQQMGSMRQTMMAFGDGAKKIWITEFGAPTGGPGQPRITTQLEFTYPNDFMTEAAQAQIADDATRLYQQSTSWLGAFFWYSLKDLGATPDTTENFFGVLRSDNNPKPAYHILQNFFKAP